MATNDSLKNKITPTTNNGVQQVNAKQLTLKSLLSTPTMQAKFNEVLDSKSSGFMASLLNLVNGDPNLAEAEPMSVITSAMVAATLDLPIDKNLGYAYLVPFRDWKKNNVKVAQFQLGYKGYIQLAQRSGQYKALNVTPIYEGELISWNRLTEEIELDMDKKNSDEVVGYVGYFKLLNGFEKTVYWTKQEMEAHRIKHNKAKDKTKLANVWLSDYDAMACKTVLRGLLSKWGILSIEMQTAEINDGKAATIDGNMIDIPEESPREVEPLENPENDNPIQEQIFDDRQPPLS